MDEHIDFHSHVLPNMDDGSDSVETSLALLRELSAQGMTTVCATAHYYRRRESIDQYIARRISAFRSLSEHWSSDLPKLIPGAEIAFFPGIGEKENLSKLCLGGTRTLLVEMPFSHWPASVWEEVMHLELDRNFQVVLAHPERYTDANLQALKRLAQAGIGFQVNADTLIRWGTRKKGLELLEMTEFPALGSDCHNLTSRQPHIDKAREIMRKKKGEAFLRTLDESMEQMLALNVTEAR